MSTIAIAVSSSIGPMPLDQMTRAQFYKTFYGRNLQIFVIDYSVSPWQAFQTSLIFVGKDRGLP